MKKSISRLLLGIITILSFNGLKCTPDQQERNITVEMNAENVTVYNAGQNDTLSIITKPLHGKASRVEGKMNEFSVDNSIWLSYTPNTDYIGKDKLTVFTSAKGALYDKGIMITININVVDSNLIINNKPIAYDKNITIDYETETDFNITGSDVDNDTLTFVIESNTTHGTLVLIDNTIANVIYTPNVGYSGADHFTFKAVDENNASSNIADVNITVKSQCETDPTAQGCPADPCIANPTITPGCPDFDPCLVDPQSSPTCPGYFVGCDNFVTEFQCSTVPDKCIWLIDECVPAAQ